MKMHKNTFGMAGLTAAAAIGATLAVSPVAAADDHTTSLVGPGCAAYAAQVPSGPGSVAGLAAGSVTAATANSPLLTTLNAALSGKLNPNVNMWQLSEPLIRDWAKQHLSKPAMVKNFAREAAETMRDTPRVLREAKQFLDDVQKHGVTLSAASLASLEAQRAAQHRAWMRLGWTAIVVAVMGIGAVYW